ncbi:hypothetical protein HWV62_9333 [Athelia sp. TMB]|nr:hypothetical protein HWV62_9333 [Athelia sp. TMB]
MKHEISSEMLSSRGTPLKKSITTWPSTGLTAILSDKSSSQRIEVGRHLSSGSHVNTAEPEPNRFSPLNDSDAFPRMNNTPEQDKEIIMSPQHKSLSAHQSGWKSYNSNTLDTPNRVPVVTPTRMAIHSHVTSMARRRASAAGEVHSQPLSRMTAVSMPTPHVSVFKVWDEDGSEDFRYSRDKGAQQSIGPQSSNSLDTAMKDLLSEMRMSKGRRLPFLLRNLRRGFSFTCHAHGIPIKSLPEESSSKLNVTMRSTLGGSISEEEEGIMNAIGFSFNLRFTVGTLDFEILADLSGPLAQDVYHVALNDASSNRNGLDPATDGTWAHPSTIWEPDPMLSSLSQIIQTKGSSSHTGESEYPSTSQFAPSSGTSSTSSSSNRSWHPSRPQYSSSYGVGRQNARTGRIRSKKELNSGRSASASNYRKPPLPSGSTKTVHTQKEWTNEGQIAAFAPELDRNNRETDPAEPKPGGILQDYGRFPHDEGRSAFSPIDIKLPASSPSHLQRTSARIPKNSTDFIHNEVLALVPAPPRTSQRLSSGSSALSSPLPLGSSINQKAPLPLIAPIYTSQQSQAHHTHVTKEDDDNPLVSRRPGGPRPYDVVNTLPLTQFGMLSWFILEREEEMFELHDIADEDKVVQALWGRWILLHRLHFVEDYYAGTLAFIDKNWAMIDRAAGWAALRAFLLVRIALNYF